MLKFILNKIGLRQEGIPRNVLIVNLIFQKIFRIDANCDFSKNFTSRVISPEKLKIHSGSISVFKSLAVSGGCYIQANAGIEIGKGTLWASNVTMVSQGHDPYDLTSVPKKQVDPIIIGSHCWLGAGVTILPGVELGDNTVVGANSVVTSSFPNGNVIIGGTPAKVIKHLDPTKLSREGS